MKGIVLKDFYLGKKMLTIGGVLLVLIQSLEYIVRFAYVYGNLKDLTDDDNLYSLIMVDVIFPVLTALLMLIFCFVAVNTSIYEDFKSKWNAFLYTTHHPESQIIKVKFTETLAVWIGGMLLSLLLNGVYHAIFSTEYSSFGVLLSVECSLMALCLQFVGLALSYKCRNANTVTVILIGILSIPYVLMMVLAFKLLDYFQTYDVEVSAVVRSWVSSHIGFITLMLVVITVLCGCISYRVCLATFKRRDKICGG